MLENHRILRRLIKQLFDLVHIVFFTFVIFPSNMYTIKNAKVINHEMILELALEGPCACLDEEMKSGDNRVEAFVNAAMSLYVSILSMLGAPGERKI